MKIRHGQSSPQLAAGIPVSQIGVLTATLQRLGWKAGTVPWDAKLTQRALYIWRQRPDLQSVFKLESRTGRAGLFWWYLLHGYHELGLEPDGDGADLSQAINRSLPGLVQHAFTPITWLMHQVYRRANLDLGDLQTRDGQERVLAWFFAKGLTGKRLGDFLTLDQANALRAPVPGKPGLPRIASFIWQSDPDLHLRFTGEDDPAFLNWCRGEGARNYPILSHPSVMLARPWRPQSRVSGRFGVNLIGHAFGRSGLSEEVRASALSLESAGIPFIIHDLAGDEAIAAEHSALLAYASRELRFDINFFSCTGQSVVGAVVANPELGRDRRYSIGLWPWELPEWPRFWQHAYGFVDEVWASTRFTYDSYCRSAPIPVRHLPMAVTVDPSEQAVRSDFGLAPDRFLFAFAFDGLSTFARKNPEACVAAFLKAFPDRHDPVGLVVKGLRADGSAAWQRLLSQIGDDPRIHVITESLTRGRLLDLYRAIDCFVSLHRSEGFGRNIAEAMLLEKPVIVTAHSGNMDFTEAANAALVPVRFVPVADGEYPYGAGQMWAEPDVTAAARMMRRMVVDHEWRQRIARAGKAHISQQYSPQAVGQRWLDALQDKRLQSSH